MDYQIRFLPEDIMLWVKEGKTLLEAEIQAGLSADAPCGGRGTCGKCKVTLENGETVSACQTLVDRDMTVIRPEKTEDKILQSGRGEALAADGLAAYTLAFDVGTTTIVGYLSDGKTGKLLATLGRRNPQSVFGADVISRIQYVLDHGPEAMSSCVLEQLVEMTRELAGEAKLEPSQIAVAAIVGNTAMHHLLLKIDPRPLVTPPYMPEVRQAMELENLLPIGGKTRVLPNIAGFVGADTVGCLVSTRFDTLENISLMIDIGTNGEMVLGNRERAIACSTAAGPAFEGAKISCGMRGTAGAIDHVFLKNGEVCYHVLGEVSPKGICGSGLLDLIAVLLETGDLDSSGRLETGDFTLAPGVVLTQKDVREVQLAKAAIRAGMEMLAQSLKIPMEAISQVYLAGAFGNYLDPKSACVIGMIPPTLLERIVPIGNAAGDGARLCSLSREAFRYSCKLAKETEFLELAGLPEFQDRYVDALLFEEDTQ